MGGVPELISALLPMLPARKSEIESVSVAGTFPHSSFVEVGFAPLY